MFIESIYPNKRGILFLVLIIILSNFISANALINVSINAQDEFKIDDVISFNYTIISNEDISIKFIQHYECISAPIPFYETKEVRLRANQSYFYTYTHIIVNDIVEPQICIAYIKILEPIIQSFEKSFKIATNPSFTFNIILCKDQSCKDKSKIFLLNENIYLDYLSEIQNPSITTTLTIPTKTAKQLTLPSTIKAEQIGTYELQVTSSKPGYKTITKKEQFAVIEKPAEIKSVNECNADGICNNKENSENCPEDCHLKQSKSSKISDKISKFSSEKWDTYTLYLITGLIIITICFILRGFIRKNKN